MESVNIEVYSPEELTSDILATKLCSLDDSRQIIAVDYHDMLEDIRKGFHNTSDIWHQFRIDMVRMNLTINQCRVEDPEIVMDYLQAQYGLERGTMIMMLCTQASLALPMEL